MDGLEPDAPAVASSPMNAFIPKRVVMALLAQLALLAVDIASLAIVAFGAIGAMESTSRSSNPDVDSIMRAMLVAYGLSSAIGVGLGSAASIGLYRGAPWARSAALAHGIVTLVSCCPCNWVTAILALVAALHPDVRSWPSSRVEHIAETFR